MLIDQNGIPVSVQVNESVSTVAQSLANGNGSRRRLATSILAARRVASPVPDVAASDPECSRPPAALNRLRLTQIMNGATVID
jgi:hypothetical protein